MEKELQAALETQRIARDGTDPTMRSAPDTPRAQNRELFTDIFGEAYDQVNSIFTDCPTLPLSSGMHDPLPPSSPPQNTNAPVLMRDPDDDLDWLDRRTPSPSNETATDNSASEAESHTTDNDHPSAPHCRRADQISSTLCNGQRVKWTAGPIWTTYSYQLHFESKMPYQLTKIEEDDWLVLRSNNCRYELLPGEEDVGTCTRCSRPANSAYLQKLLDRASLKDLPAETQYKYFSHAQLTRLVRRQRAEINRLRHQVRLFNA